jgi:ABC-2 type transport system ATP-binding protein
MSKHHEKPGTGWAFSPLTLQELRSECSVDVRTSGVTPAMAPALETRRLRKLFGEKVAVRGLDLEVARGEVFGFLGPNGAGKSTSMKMLLGLVKPTSGIARVLGKPAGEVRVRAKVGYLPEHFRFYDWLTGAELLNVYGRLYGMPRHVLRERVPTLLDDVGLSMHSDKQLKEYSKGMLQRVGLAQALLNEPDLVFLDEPTSGLDPAGRRLVRDIIHAERDRGATVFLNSHLLGEVEVTCDRVAFIKHGEVLETRHIDALKDGAVRVSIRTGPLNAAALEQLRTLAGEIRREQDRVSFGLPGRGQVPEIVRMLVAHGVDVYDVIPEKTSLEDLFFKIVGTDGGL